MGQEMPLYSYTALTEAGVRVTGEGVAASVQELTQELTRKGLLIQQIRKRRAGFKLFHRERVEPEEFLLFNQEFMALVRAGLTIPEALQLAANRPDNPGLGRILQRVLEDVRGGVILSEACARHREVFDALYVSALKTGEKTGDLSNVLARYQDYLRHRVALRKKISQALAYPTFLLIALAVILAVLFAFVMPRFVAMYADFGARLPWATQVLIDLVEHMPLIAPAVAVLAVGVWFGWRSWTATDSGRMAVDRLKEGIPYIGSINRIAGVAQLARSLSTLLAGGTPLVEAMRTAQESVTNRAYGARLTRATQQVVEGGSLTQALKAENLMPDTALKMVEVGEASGKLDGMLAEVAQFYEETLDHRLARVMTLIEPLLMLLMGVLVGGTIIAMYLPIFNMAEVIK
jgi:type IV pilus assembly protein PilC